MWEEVSDSGPSWSSCFQTVVAHTMAKGNTELCVSPTPGEAVDVTVLLKRQRSTSSNCSDSGFEGGILSPLEEEPMSIGSPIVGSPMVNFMHRQRVRYISESESSVTSQQGRRSSYVPQTVWAELP
ncbi:uncharacterized protein LOC128548782 [Mercenaria mercenaria]|uniref:uncharacterized protein LOC128548782 n=1 Tax=Mercenaria mercenaria TaxID=6596 RepID=UPI00234EB64D|nr:uncharacterized protein LOC128548782 [Mercenaria mercenaria]